MNKSMRQWLSIFASLGCLLSLPAQAVEVQEIAVNDTKAWFVADDSVPVLQVTLAFKQAGWAGDSTDAQGRASLLAAMLMEGAGDRNALQFHQALEEKAISISMDAQRDDFVIGIYSLSEHSAEAFALLREALSNPQLSEASLSEAKARQLASLRRAQESPEYVASRELAQMLYGDHPYARTSFGTAESVQAITAEDLHDYLKAALTQDRVIISAVGALDKRTLKRELNQLLDSLPKEATHQPALDDIVIDSKGQWREVTMDIPQSIVMVATQGIKRDDPDYYAAYVMNHILGGSGLTSRLSDAIRDRRGLAYYAGSELNVSNYAQSWQAVFATRSEQVKESLSAFNESLATMAKDGVSEAERDAAIGYITGSFPLNMDDSSSIAAYLMAMQRYELGRDYLDKRNSYFEAVTVEQINKVAARLLDTNQLKVVKLGGISADEGE